jgi:hypothetical protein
MHQQNNSKPTNTGKTTAKVIIVQTKWGIV